MKVITKRTRVFVEGEDLEAFILKYIPKLKEKSVLVVTSKIAALAEGRTAYPKDRERIIKAESTLAIRTKYTWLTIKDGTVMASAGGDERKRTINSYSERQFQGCGRSSKEVIEEIQN